MSNIFVILIISLVFKTNSNIIKVNVKPNDEVILKDKSACVCFQLNDDIKKDNSFYLEVNSEDKGARIDKTIYYNYIDLCDSDDSCEDNTYINYNKNNDITIEKEDSDSFSYEYEFKLDNNKHRAFIIQYKDFTGKELKMKYTTHTQSDVVLIIVIIISSFFVLSTIVLIIIIFYQRKRLKDLLSQINKITFANEAKKERLSTLL